MELSEMKYAVEALLFACERPLIVEQIKDAFEPAPTEGDIQSALDELKNDYETQNRGFRLLEIAGGYQIATDVRFSENLKRFYTLRLKKKLSQATLETLSVIAYKQPVTRADIEFIRGVNVDGAVKALLEKGLIKIAGRKEVPGRPILYATTKDFLDRFGLNSIKELPALSEFTVKDIDPNLLPAEMKAEMEANDAAAKSDPEYGMQKAVGCANGPDTDETASETESQPVEKENEPQ